MSYNMLVISNTCCGGYFYNYMNTQYNNPFIWCRVLYDSMYQLATNWFNINFLNFKVYLAKEPINSHSIIIDDKVYINYPHHLYDPTAEQLIKQKICNNSLYNYWVGDMRYKDMTKIVVEQYLRRVIRMLKSNKKPCFIIRDDEKYLNYPSHITINQLLNDIQFKCIILTENKQLICNNPNVKILNVNNIQIHPEIQIRNNLTEIKKYINEFYLA